MASSRKSAASQFVFKKRFNTNNCISILATDIDKSMCLVVFMDVLGLRIASAGLGIFAGFPEE